MYSFEKGQRPLNPYVAGALAGAVSVASALLTGNFMNPSSAFSKLGAGLLDLLAPEHSASLAYFIEHPFALDWQILFLSGIFVGSFISSTVSGTFFIDAVPELWRDRFGSRSWLRLLTAFFGGVLVALGAHMAEGGLLFHGLGGGMQLSLGGAVFLAASFLGGAVMARILYGRD